MFIIVISNMTMDYKGIYQFWRQELYNLVVSICVNILTLLCFELLNPETGGTEKGSGCHCHRASQPHTSRYLYRGRPCQAFQQVLPTYDLAVHSCTCTRQYQIGVRNSNNNKKLSHLESTTYT